MITVNSVSKSFNGQPAVKEVSFTANDKEILVLLGPSGCGKTTTLKMINRLIEPDSGSILINGNSITAQQPEELRRSIGFVMQHAGLFPHYNIAQNIAVLPSLLGWNKKKVEDKTLELLEKLNLPADILTRYPRELSGGQQQRVGIARALISNTSILLMDEPFGALDNVTRAEIHKEFKSLEELKNKTTILVTHDVQEAFDLGHRICLMNAGEIVQIGTPKEMLYEPANAFVKEFFTASRLVLEYKIVSLYELKGYITNYDALVQKIKIDSDANVWEVLQMIGGERDYAQAYEDILSAFNEYRKMHSI